MVCAFRSLQVEVVAGTEEPIPWVSVQITALQRAPVSDVHIKQGLGRWEASLGFVVWAAPSKLPTRFRRMGKDSKLY